MEERPVEILLVEDNPNDVELTLHAFKRNNLTNRVPVARDGDEAVESYQLGVNSYIVKPVDFEQFTEDVRQLELYWVLLNQPPGM